VYVWDIEHPACPIAECHGHDGITSCFTWKVPPPSPGELGGLLSASKDQLGSLIHHRLAEAYFPYEKVCTEGIAWAADGRLAQIQDIVDRSHGLSSAPSGNLIDYGTTGTKQGWTSPPRHIKTGQVVEVQPQQMLDNSLLMVHLAQRLQLEGGPQAQASCATNARVCEAVGSSQLGTMWRMLQQLLTDNEAPCNLDTTPTNTTNDTSLVEREDGDEGGIEDEGAQIVGDASLLSRHTAEATEEEDTMRSEQQHEWVTALESPLCSAFTQQVLQGLFDELAEFYGDLGDVQTCAVLSCVLRDHLTIDEGLFGIQCWEYIQLLHRVQAWNEAAMTARHCKEPEIESNYGTGSSIYVGCGVCGKANNPIGLVCDRCNAPAPPCALCHLPVHGPYAWCQGCGHGGHQQCMNEWFKTEVECPAACGHVCCTRS